MDVGHLAPLEQTALLTEYCRALDQRAARPILGDRWSDETVRAIDYDFSSLAATPSVVPLVALRAKMLDDIIRTFVSEHRDAVVVDLGAGLSSAVHRVDPGPGVDWYSVDRPAVLAVRAAVLPAHPADHPVPADLAVPGWAAEIPADRPAMMFADGLIAFLDEATVKALFADVTTHFAAGLLAFNDYGPVSKLNRMMGRLATSRKTNSPHDQWNFPGFADARRPESWNPRLTLRDEQSVMQRPEAADFPRGLRLAARLSHRVPAIARKARVLSYRF
ncbi:class I SAM-dependent methyltransferase [Mycolicibacterium sp. 018/SC-01/001]|uniref:class I SAM-dependent methyltransferase n=1 Tax=Mycolicibacterium sp. 018/SC-01/001 TaxID=2592069 RepID=UPI00117CE2ED|nr:class I SAM-dependent methyltransferase [Mycolicibacterium sp. 018/SC-01/001]TRW82379.1 class I SAM-dependent methyltransferase [Mycolicibacterium sp. 018/SC-01/001]